MWRAIISSSRIVEKVLPELLCVLEDWPLHSTSTSDKDNSDVFPLAVSFWARPKHILKDCLSGISPSFVTHPSLYPMVPHMVF